MTKSVEAYLAEGCGRCALGNTPQCKVNSWLPLLNRLRHLVLECGLTEECKWGVPCYTFEKKNILIVSAFKEYCAISFFKGALLKDEHQLLSKPGENSQEGRLIKFTVLKDIEKKEKLLKAYIFEAIEIERAGIKMPPKKAEAYPMPTELEERLKMDPKYKAAFEALTAGRQRGYIIHFAKAKQPETRRGLIEKFLSKIMQGKGPLEY
ncbi:MAG: YdeI/OmpD-associated family protein [Bacteroidetes bacterium]|nr:YdeI/OmpD-associated family protein [Bacteroidota bacterium]